MGIFSKTLVCALVMAGAQTAYAADIVTHVSVKQPGNHAVTYQLREQGDRLVADAAHD